MNLTSKVVCICLIFIASTDGWIFKIWQCGTVFWPSNWDHRFSGPTYDRLTYICTVTMEPSGNWTSLVEIVGKHSNGKTDADIEVIDIIVSPRYSITGIPSNIGNLLPNLIGVGFYGEPISSITAEDLRQIPNITYLAFSDTQIVALEGDLFEYTPHIQALLVPSNKIVSVGQNLLGNLENLKFVDFLQNPCLSYYASTPQQLEWLQGNLTVQCPPTTTTTEQPTTTTTEQPTTTTTEQPTTTTTEQPTTTTTEQKTTRTASTTPTVPPAKCEIRCSINAEADKLKDELIKQSALIRDLHEILSNYRVEMDELKSELINQGALIGNLYALASEHNHRIFELEKIDEK